MYIYTTNNFLQYANCINIKKNTTLYINIKGGYNYVLERYSQFILTYSCPKSHPKPLQYIHHHKVQQLFLYLFLPKLLMHNFHQIV